MKRTAIFCLLSLVSLCAIAGYDHIILRNGEELDVKLYQVTDQKVVFGNRDKRDIDRREVPSTEVYMVYIDKQGNVYFDRTGKRTTGESVKADPKKFDCIYLVSGGEIPAENIRITSDIVKYDINRNQASGLKNIFSGKDKRVEEQELPKNSVFMIRYRNGMTDIITPIDMPEEPENSQEDDAKAKEPEFKVVFHSVVAGETLKSIAEDYNVTPEQIKEWNDLPTRQPINARLKIDMQLMIYQPNK